MFITDLAVVDTRFFLIVPYIFDIMKMKGSDRIRKNLVKSVCVIILTVLILCSGCTAVLQELENAEIEGESGGGLVKVVVNGKKVVSSITIRPNAVDPDDMEMLEDLIIAALNSAYDAADELYEEKMGKFGNAGGMF